MRIHSGLYYRFWPSSFGHRVRRSPLLTWQKKPILTVKNHVNIHEWSWNIMNINILHAFLQFQWFFFREEFFSGGPKTVWFLILKTNNFLASGMCQVPSLKIHQNREQKFSSPFSPILYQFMNITSMITAFSISKIFKFYGKFGRSKIFQKSNFKNSKSGSECIIQHRMNLVKSF